MDREPAIAIFVLKIVATVVFVDIPSPALVDEVSWLP